MYIVLTIGSFNRVGKQDIAAVKFDDWKENYRTMRSAMSSRGKKRVKPSVGETAKCDV